MANSHMQGLSLRTWVHVMTLGRSALSLILIFCPPKSIDFQLRRQGRMSLAHEHFWGTANQLR